MSQIQAQPEAGNSRTSTRVSIRQKVRRATDLGTWVGLGLAVVFAGCAEAPPLRGKPSLLDFLADGQTTREETLLKLGEPNGKFDGERILTYRLGFEAKSQGCYVVVNQQAQPAHAWHSWSGARYSLVLVFDEGGVLKRHSLLDVN